MVNANPPALKVRVRTETWRNIVLKADPDVVQTSKVEPEYEFNAGRRKFEARTATRGAYGDE